MKENEESIPINLDSPSALDQEVPSEFTPKYLQFFGLSLDRFNKLKAETLEEAQRMIIVDRQRDFRRKALIKMVGCSKGCEFIHFEVALGPFVFPRIDVLNKNSDS